MSDMLFWYVGMWLAYVRYDARMASPPGINTASANRIGMVLLGFGILLIVAGWLAAFSDIGSAAITAGLVVAGLGVGVRWRWAGSVAALALFALAAWLAWDWIGRS